MPEQATDAGQVTDAPTTASVGTPEATGATEVPTTESVGSDTTGQQETSFARNFDPNSISDPNLLQAYKQMQKDYNQGKEFIKQHRQKIDAYDRFTSNPQSVLQQYAQQLGYQLAPVGQPLAAQSAEQQQWEPQTWEEVRDNIKQDALLAAKQEFQPMVQELQNLKKQNIETYLDGNCPNWRNYEEEMKANLQRHPTLSSDPMQLYKISVPPNVFIAQGAKRTIDKINANIDGSVQSGTSTTARATSAAPNEKINSISDAFAYAKNQVENVMGLKRSGGMFPG